MSPFSSGICFQVKMLMRIAGEWDPKIESGKMHDPAWMAVGISYDLRHV